MVGVARSGREPGACAGARQRDTSGGGRGAGTCLQPGLRSPDNTGPEMETTRLAQVHFLTRIEKLNLILGNIFPRNYLSALKSSLRVKAAIVLNIL